VSESSRDLPCTNALMFFMMEVSTGGSVSRV
jgi:hypothetical protein